MLRHLLCMIFLVAILPLMAQSTNCSTGLVLKSVEAEIGEEVLIDVTVRDVAALVGLQYSHSWNPEVLEFVEIVYPMGSPIDDSNFNFSEPLVDIGLMNFAYSDSSLEGLGLPDDSVLYQIQFIYLGGTTEVRTDDASIPIEFVTVDVEDLNSFYLMHASVGPSQLPSGVYPTPLAVCINGLSCDNGGEGNIALEVNMEEVIAYSWLGPNNYANTVANIAELDLGTYTLTLTGQDGRTTIGDFYVGNPENALSISFATDADECGENPDGSITTSVQGGSGQYEYNWSNGATTADINNLEEGEYTLTVTDAGSGCSVEATATVDALASFPVWYNSTPASCSATSDGSIVVFTDAPADALPLTYQWSNGATTAEITGLSSGNYSVTITAANDCIATLTVDIWSGDFFISGEEIIDDNCSAEPSGSISLPFFSADTHEITWSTGASGTNTITNLEAGGYAVTVTHTETGCSAQELFIVGEQEIITAASVECYLESGLSLADLNALIWNPEDGPYTFDWSTGVSNTAQQLSSITVSENGIYSVTVTSASGCSTTIEEIEVDCINESFVSLYFDPATSNLNNGDNACFQVMADGFTDILGFQFSLNWDQDVLNFTNLQAFNIPSLDESDFGLALVSDGVLPVSWIDDQTSSSATLPAGSPLFEICFDVIASDEINTTLSMSDFPTPFEFFNDAEDILLVNTQTAVLYLNGGTGGGGDEFTVTAGSTAVEIGDNTCVPISIGQVNDLIGFQFALAWDPEALLYTGVQELNLPDLTEASNFGSLAESQNEGRLRVLWNDLNLTGLNLAEETVAFEICFLANGPEGDYPLSFDANTLVTEAINSSLEYMSTTTIGGEVTVDEASNNSDDISLLINSVGVEPGESVCVPVEAVNFNDIVGMQFSINWDAELLNFNGVEVIEDLNFLSEDDFNSTNSGTLVCSWIDANLAGRNFDEGTVLFELCFTASEEEGTAGIIFSNQPTPIEFITVETAIIPFVPINGEVVISADGLVWPGDMNNDGLANNMDALHLGLAHGATGPARNNSSINWQAQYADSWSVTTPQTLTDYRHIDADGNGLINTADTLALSLNWAQSSDGFTGGGTELSEQSFTGAPIFIEEQTVLAGVRIRLPIILGIEELTVDDAYGVAFTINYETEKVEINSPHMIYNGWLSGEGGEVIGMYQDFPDLGKIEVVMVRTDGQNVDGNGQIAELSIIMEDVIIANFTDVEAVFSIDNVRLISYAETELATSPRTSSIIVEGVTAVNEQDELSKIILSPNPTNGLVHLAHDGIVIEQLKLQDANGRLVSIIDDQENIDLSNYPVGVYILQIQTRQGTTYRRLIKQ